MGKINEPGSKLTFTTGGTATMFNPADLTDQGFVKAMLLLGPYWQRFFGGGSTPGETNIRKDYLSDGAAITELTVAPRDGDIVNTRYNTAAFSTGLVATPGAPQINPGGKPTWKEWRDDDDTIDFNNYYGNGLNSSLTSFMMYAVFYVIAEKDFSGIELGLSSDDSVQVRIDNREVWINNISRGFDLANVVLDIVPGIDLSIGLHKVMVKVFNGGDGEHGFRIRFQDPTTQEGSTEGLRICLSPSPEECAGEPPPLDFRRGDVDNTAVLDVTDVVNLLYFLFLGQSQVTCQDAADFDDSGAVDITDAVNILLFLFAGGAPPPAPGTLSCGSDPTADTTVPGGDLGCVSYGAGCN